MATKPTMRKPGQTQQVVVPALVLPESFKASSDQESMSKTLQERAPVAAQPSNGSVPSGFAAANQTVNGTYYQVGQSYDVPLSKCVRSKNNARNFYIPDEVAELAESLSANGQKQDALGFVKDGRIVISDGQKRHHAAVQAGLQTLAVKIIDEPEEDASEYEISRLVNLQRSPQSAIDDAIRWRDLLERGVYRSQDHLAERLKLKKEYVSKVLGIGRIPEVLLKMMVDHEATRAWTIAYTISCIFEPKRVEANGIEKSEAIAEEIIDAVQKRGLSKKQVEDLIKSKLDSPRRRLNPESTPVSFGGSKGELKVFAERGQLDLSFKGLTEDGINSLKKVLENALKSSSQG